MKWVSSTKFPKPYHETHLNTVNSSAPITSLNSCCPDGSGEGQNFLSSLHGENADLFTV
jgi:hypothetical protein